MIPKPSLFYVILLILGLLTQMTHSADYIKNSEFLTTPQGKSSSNPGENYIVDNWYGVFPNSSPQQSFIKVIKANDINPSSPSVNAIVLMNNNITQGSDNNVCMYQELGTMNAGQYTFSFVSIISKNNPNPKNEKLQVQISGEKQTQGGSMEYAMLLNKNVQFEDSGEVKYEDLIVAKDELKTVYLLICNTPLVVYGARKTSIAEIAIRNVHLVSGKVAKSDEATSFTTARITESKVSTVRQPVVEIPMQEEEQQPFIEPKQPTIEELQAKLIPPPKKPEEDIFESHQHDDSHSGETINLWGTTPITKIYELPVAEPEVPKKVEPEKPKTVVSQPEVVKPAVTEKVIEKPVVVQPSTTVDVLDKVVPEATNNDKNKQGGAIKIQTQPTKTTQTPIQQTKPLVVDSNPTTTTQTKIDTKSNTTIEDNNKNTTETPTNPSSSPPQPTQPSTISPTSHQQSLNPPPLSFKDLINYYINGQAQIVKTDDKSYVFYKSGDRTFALFVEQRFDDGLLFMNSEGKRMFLNNRKGSEPKSVVVDVNGNFYVEVGNGVAEVLVDGKGEVRKRMFLIDGQHNLYIKNSDGSVTYFSGPNAGTTIYTDSQGTFSLNYDGSKQYITSNKPKPQSSTPTQPFTPNPQSTQQQTPSTTNPPSQIHTTTFNQIIQPDYEQELKSPSLKQIIERFISGKAKIVKTDDKSYIYYRDQYGRHFAVFIEQTYDDGIAYTDSDGNKYFLSSEKGSQPVPIQKDEKGNMVVKTSNGQIRILVPPKPLDQPKKLQSQSTPSSSSPTSPQKPPIAIDTKPLPMQYTDQFGHRYTLQPNNARLYTTGPFKGKQLFADENNDLFSVNRDKTRMYFTGENFGKVVGVDWTGNPYAWNVDGSATYIIGELRGVKVQKDGQGNLYRLEKDGRRTYVNGNNAGKTTSIDSKGDFYLLNQDTSRRYLSGQFSGNTLFSDIRHQLYLKVSQTERHYMTGESAGKILTVDHYGDLYTEEKDGGRLYTTGEFKGKLVFSDQMNYIYARREDGSREYLSGEMKGKMVWIDEVSKDLYVVDGDKKRVYLTGPLVAKGGVRTIEGSKVQGVGEQPQHNVVVSEEKIVVTPVIQHKETIVFEKTVINDHQQATPKTIPESTTTTTTTVINKPQQPQTIIQRLIQSHTTVPKPQPTQTVIITIPQVPSTSIVNPHTQAEATQKPTIIVTPPTSKPSSDSKTSNQSESITQTTTFVISQPSSTPLIIPINQQPATPQQTTSVPQFINPFPGFINPFANQPSASQSITIPTQPTYQDDFVKPPTTSQVYPYIFIDPSTNKFVLNKEGKRNYLYLVPGSSVSANPAVYQYNQGGRYFLYVDEVSGNRYVKNGQGKKLFVTGFDQIAVREQEIKDQNGGVYAIYVDKERNEYVVYGDNNGKWFYYNSQQTKIQLSIQSTSSSSQSTKPTTNPATKSSQPIYLTPTGQQYILTPSGTRTYLHLISSDTKSFIVQDPTNIQYTIFIDQQNNLYTNNGVLKNYLTGHPFDPVGQKTIGKDTQGITYGSVADAYGNMFVVYTDQNGKYFFDSNRNRVNIRNSGSNLRAN